MEMSQEGLSTPMSSEGSSSASDDPTTAVAPAHSRPRIQCCLARPQDDDIGNDTVTFEFLNEGAANAVFRLRPCPPHQTPCFVFLHDDKTLPRSSLLGKVLRISKGKPKTLRSDDIVAGFEKEVRPLFRPKSPDNVPSERGIMLPSGRQDPLAMLPSSSYEEYLIDPELVFLSADVLKVLLNAQYGPFRIPNAPLREQRGILLPDMSSTPGVSLTVEFKPKWLATSPNAPPGAYRCRTCALHAKRLATTDLPPPPYLCPLQLMARNKDLIEKVVKDKLRRHSDGNSDIIVETVTERAVEYLTSGPGFHLLQHLRHLQVQLDPEGVLWEPETDDIEISTHRLRLAMTLRDCSLFLRIPYIGSSLPIEAKLVDLDFKSGDKINDWYRKEVGLRNGGWYTDLEAGVDHCLIAEGWRKHVPHYM